MRALMYAMLVFVTTTLVANAAPLCEVDLKNLLAGIRQNRSTQARFSRKVTTGPMPLVQEHRVGHRQPIHPTAQIGSMHLRNWVNMIAHQHKGKNRRIKSVVP